MDKEALFELLGNLGDNASEDCQAVDLDTLKCHAAHLIASPAQFKPGDVVVWKAGMQNKKLPAYGAPIVVTEVFAEPLIGNEDKDGSAYHREPLHFKACTVDRDGDFVEYHFDARRFELYTAE